MSFDGQEIMFRADASISGGAGHLVRCLALAARLRESGCKCTFAVNRETRKTVTALSRLDYEIIELPASGENEAAILSGYCPENVSWLVVDHYQRDAAFESACRPWAKNILVIDDLADREHDCNILLDPVPGRSTGDYRGRVPANCRLLLGPDYVLLREQFAHERKHALARNDRAACKRIFVSFGATDPQGYTLVALEGIQRAAIEVAVDVMISAVSPHKEAIMAAAGSMPFPLTVHIDADNVALLMAKADLAIGASGSTAWERCCLGLPAIIAVTADNQREIAAALVSAGAAILLDAGNDFAAVSLASELADLCASSSRLSSLSAAAAAICDGQGAVRARDIMLQ